MQEVTFSLLLYTQNHRMKNARQFLKNDSSKIFLSINNTSTLIKSNLCIGPPEQGKWV